MRVLYIGGSGEISFDCIHETVRLGHDVSVFNRGNNNAGLPDGVQFIKGDINDVPAYVKLASAQFDVVCQFRIFSPEEMARDIVTFSGNCGQYIFISTASAYRKPVRGLPITEEMPLENPFWAYSRAKAAMEGMLAEQNGMAYTIVRPSHTYRTRMPTALGGEVSRLLRGLPVVVHGDGESLWTITHASDFARPFVRLLGNPAALGEAFHITNSRSWSWNEIFYAMAGAIGVANPDLVHVATDTLVRYEPEWIGPLHGDKSASVLFDNSKVKSVAGDFECLIDPWLGMEKVASEYPPSREPHTRDALYDRIIADQRALGA